MRILNNYWFATIVPAAVGFGFVMLCVRFFSLYGSALFLGLPVVVCFLSAFCTSYRRKVAFPKVYWISVVSLLFLGAMIILFAVDGAVCLVMAFPLAMLLGFIGAALGLAAGRGCSQGIIKIAPLLVVILFPGLVAFEARETELPPIRSVTTSVEINAPIGRVWNVVVAFPRINEPADGIFRLGIAYPVEARIDGSGVGAVRYCTFSTGSFVEPITQWKPPALLAFSVTSCPPPMNEFSLYKNLQPPHLHGFMVSRHGQFRLYERNGRVVLEGTTWYTHSLAPQWYWGPVSDFIIHRIHERVLNHIRAIAESDPGL